MPIFVDTQQRQYLLNRNSVLKELEELTLLMPIGVIILNLTENVGKLVFDFLADAFGKSIHFSLHFSAWNNLLDFLCWCYFFGIEVFLFAIENLFGTKFFG